MTRPSAVHVVVAVVGVALFASTSWAQQDSGIAGLVTDAQGAVLPGTTVEASSPALIEGVRTVVTDGQGRYNVINLRPGTYTVTFTLPGFSTVIRENVVLVAGFTAPIDAQMAVGGIEETVTVTGVSPLVDVQNVSQNTVISDRLLDLLPSSNKSLSNFTNMIPGMTGNPDIGGAAGLLNANQVRPNTFHGKGGVKFEYDGMKTANFASVGSISYIMNPHTAVEMQVETAGVSAESNSSAMRFNYIPKEGSNSFESVVSGVFTDDGLQADNLTPALEERGLRVVNKVLRVYDFNYSFGGPIVRDKLWFFTATRFTGNQNQLSGLFFNKTPGDACLCYTPDFDRPAFKREWLRSIAGRLTWQASERNKINLFADIEAWYARGRGSNNAPEAFTAFNFWPDGLYQASWSSPVSNRLLLEAGWSLTRGSWPRPRSMFRESGQGFPDMKDTDINIQEATTGLRYNAAGGFSDKTINDRYVVRFSASYVTGSHNFKAGVHQEFGPAERGSFYNQDIAYRFRNGLPNRLTLRPGQVTFENLNADMGIYVQDQWTIDRLTLNLGLRFDYLNASIPAQTVAGGLGIGRTDGVQFLPDRSFEGVSGAPLWKDLNPRLGMAYDLTGDARTVLKASLGRYVGTTSTDIAQRLNPIRTAINTVNMAWNDANGDLVPDCDFLNPNGGGECGPYSNRNFGLLNPGATTWADEVIRGGLNGSRDYLWDGSIEVEHQLTDQLSVTTGWYRNWSDRFATAGTFENRQFRADNLAVTPADFDPYCITAPRDPRLPGGGGNEICGLADVSPEKFGQVDNEFIIPDTWHRTSDFFGITFDSRFETGLVVGGGFDIGRTNEDRCVVVDSPQDLFDCDITTPFGAQAQIKVHAAYPLPFGMFLSANIQNVSGPEIRATYRALNSLIQPSLGRPLASCAGRTGSACTRFASVELIPRQTEFEGRRTQLDVRLTKIFRLGDGGTELQANLDFYNALNGSAIMNVNRNWGANWLQPIGWQGISSPVQDGRIIQVSGRFTF